MIFNTSGGGAGLNFKIIPYATEVDLLAAKPSNNTIGVVTEHDITSWIFSLAQPTESSEGMLWVKTINDSSVGFNALKKNGLFVYPNSAMQYVDGAWKSVSAQSYINGVWVPWRVYVYNNGDTCDLTTGGWTGYAKKTNAELGSAVTPTITYNTNNVTVSTSGSSYPAAMVCTNKKIDLTHRSTLYYDGLVSTKTVYVSVWSEIGTYVESNRAAAVAIESNSRTITSVDVSSLTGEYYVGLSLKGNDTKPAATMYGMWVE